MIIGVVLAAGAGYYYYTSTSEDDVAKKARELDHAARLRADQKIEQGKEKFDEAKVSWDAVIPVLLSY